ncbi:3-hydroxyacyl-CoA dehydrogenase [Pseudorhodoferax sp.]|uniref:3-hydroxyacyl-CoA dehydrogenase n=1 Tax=Pseudorhodoferax sp. TaxID=1993553 RepID=UPI0039E6C373
MPSVAVVGAGLIGRAWAIVFARAGRQVRLYGTRSATLDAAVRSIADTLHDMDATGLLDETPGAIAARIAPTDSLAGACTGVALVQENIPETVPAKQAIFEQLDALAPPDAVLASSTSWIPASRFTAALAGRHRCLVAHPTNPPNLVPLVEVCPAPWTAQDAVSRAMDLYARAGQEPVLVRREIDGFLLNRIQGAVLNEVLNLFEQGYASTADLDKVMKHGLGLRWSFMGPFETIDLNAPAGVADYAQRYGHTYAAVGASQGPNAWSPQLVAGIEAERRRVLGADQLAQRARWRDVRLMALRAHQRRQPDGSEP